MRDAAAVPVPSAPQAVMESREGAASATAAAAALANEASPGGGSSNRVHPQRSNITLPTISPDKAAQLNTLPPAESGSSGQGAGGGGGLREPPRARPARSSSGSVGDDSPALLLDSSSSAPSGRRGSLLGLNISTSSMIEKVRMRYVHEIDELG